MSSLVQLSLLLPAGITPVPPRDADDFDRWRTELAEKNGMLTTIQDDLRRLTAAMEASPHDGRHWIVAIPPAPQLPRIAAFGWLAVGPANGVSASALAERATTPPPVHPNSLTTQLSFHELGNRCALVIHQMQAVDLVADEPGALLVERCGSILLDAERDLLITLELTVLDLRAFDDIVASSLEILKSVSVNGVS